MILADTSVWVDHLRTGDASLSAQLQAGSVITHPFVLEELACGKLKKRGEVLGLLAALPSAPRASHEELLSFIADEGLDGIGLGAVDVHLLASARLARAKLWTKDKALARAAAKLDLEWAG